MRNPVFFSAAEIYHLAILIPVPVSGTTGRKVTLRKKIKDITTRKKKKKTSSVTWNVKIAHSFDNLMDCKCINNMFSFTTFVWMMNPTTIQFTGRYIKQDGFSTIKVYVLRDFSVVALIGCQEAIVTCGTITMAPRHGFCDLEHARGNLLRNLSILSSSHWGTPKICAHYGKCPEPYRPVNGLLLTPLNPLQSFVQIWWMIPLSEPPRVVVVVVVVVVLEVWYGVEVVCVEW